MPPLDISSAEKVQHGPALSEMRLTSVLIPVLYCVNIALGDCDVAVRESTVPGAYAFGPISTAVGATAIPPTGTAEVVSKVT